MHMLGFILMYWLMYNLKKLKNTSDDDWKLWQIKQNSVNACPYIILSSLKDWMFKFLLILRFCGDKIFSLETEDGWTEVLNENER